MNKKLLLAGALLWAPTLLSIFPINWFQAWDFNLHRPFREKHGHVDIDFFNESSIKVVGKCAQDMPCGPNEKGPETNVLHVWQPDQNALAMLEGFSPDCPIGALAQQINIDMPTNALLESCACPPAQGRGRIDFCGDLAIKAHTVFGTRWYMPKGFALGVYLPLSVISLCNRHVDKTQSITADDVLTKQLVTNNLDANTERLGCLNINDWQITGIGDLAVLADWNLFFRQNRPLLKGVQTSVRFGVNIPTAKATEINDMFALPFGNEAFGFIAGAGLGLHLTRYFRIGADFEFLYLLSRVLDMRVKTNASQTELLLLAANPVLKEFGFTHRFNTFIELAYKGFSFNFTYQFWRHDDDKLAMVNNCFSTNVANTAKSLEEWTYHNFIYRLGFDSMGWDYAKYFGSPYLAFFYKQPINGKNAVLAQTLGAILNFTF
jgi:hypothetical protein